MYFLGIFPLAGLLAIILLILLKIVVLRRKGISMRAQKTGRSVSVVLLYPVFLLVLAVWFAAMMDQTFYPESTFLPTELSQNLIDQKALQAAGAAIIVLSVVLMLITLLHFKASLRFGMSRSNKGKLITSGVFSHTRNPFFLSINLYFIGQALVFPGFLFIGMAVLAVTGIHLFILREEKFMAESYSEEYQMYRQRVRRYF